MVDIEEEDVEEMEYNESDWMQSYPPKASWAF